ncbi:MAG: hypothetical protein ARM1_0251 [Candidatus Micrarchaeota archaeon]|nr:MAG: hypothetical protein ARM1_0251 [Candidatus Micrarchaeota archaeon]
MGSEIDSLYGSLWEAYEKETKLKELLDIDPLIYSKVKEIILKLDKSDKEKILSIIKDIEKIRKEKLARYAIYGKNISKPLPKEEEKVFEELIKILSRSYFDEQESAEKREAETKTQLTKTKLRAKEDLDAEILLPSGATAGPFKANSIIELDNKDDADYLVRSGLCEYL